MPAVTALGEVLIDFTDAGTSANGQKLFERNPGGAPANVLVACKRLGHDVAFIGKVGEDMHGAFLRETLEAAGIDCTGLVSFSFARKPGADTQLAASDLRRDLIEGARVFHVGSLSLTDEPARSATLEALECAKAAGCVMSYDPNYRASLWESPEAAAEQMRSIAGYMDLIKISAEECPLMTGETEPEAAAQALLAGGASVVCVTLDADGAYVAAKDGARVVPSFRVDAVDTTGAGDSFWGGFISAFLESGLEPAQVGIEQAAGFARFGNAVASLCVRKRGAIPAMPTREEVLAVLSA